MRIHIGIIAFVFTILISLNSKAEEFSESQKDRIKELAIQAIIEKPEIIEQALKRMQEIQAAQKLAQQKVTIEQRHLELTQDPNAPVLGNPEGDVTVVEFFDYNCPFCKRAIKPIKELLAQDNNVRLVFREWPILNKGSEFAARAALAAREQGKYEEMHWALMSGSRATESSTLQIAKSLGLDIDKLRVDMGAPEVDQHIKLSMDLAQGLGINGTPSFLIGNQIAPGLIPVERMLEMVETARKSSEK
jgi:protein-disulfide isomerase